MYKNLRKILIIAVSSLFTINSFSQIIFDPEPTYVDLRRFVVAIGEVINDSIQVNNINVLQKRFVPIGTGLLTYLKSDSSTFQVVITARHVTQYFFDNNLSYLYIRPSWADTIKTTEYFGERIPVIVPDEFPHIFNYPNKNVDLSCILNLTESGFHTGTFLKAKDARKAFPYNDIYTPRLGEQVWIAGYPDHIENFFSEQFPYCIATFKQGTIAWKPSLNMENTDLSHITLVESNATHGNSGGPVFTLSGKLVGTLVAGIYEKDSVYLNGRGLLDSYSKKPYLTESRSGVSIIERAEYITKLINYVQSEVGKLLQEERENKKTK